MTQIEIHLRIDFYFLTTPPKLTYLKASINPQGLTSSTSSKIIEVINNLIHDTMFSALSSKRNSTISINPMDSKEGPSTSTQDLLSAPSIGLPAYPPTSSSSFNTIPISTTHSKAPHRPPFAALSLHKTDRIRLLQFPASEISYLRAALNTSWPPGVQEERRHVGSYEFKLHGNPWSGQSSDAIPARILMTGILSCLFSAGWILTASTDVSSSVFDKDTMIFRRHVGSVGEGLAGMATGRGSRWLAISFNQGDRLRLIGSPEGALIGAFEDILKSMRLWQSGCWKDANESSSKAIWPGSRSGSKRGSWITGEKGRETWEFKLNGYPWRPSGDETMSTRMLILKMLETLERYGWSLYASLDQDNGNNGTNTRTGGLESWYCIKMDGWVEGGGVYHR